MQTHVSRALGRQMKYLLIVASVVAISIGRAGAAEGATNKAEEFVQSLGFEAINVLADASMTQDAREQEFRRLYMKGFDVDRIGRFILGRFWRVASEQELAEYRVLFRDYMVRIYLSRFKTYSGETLKIRDSRPADDNAVVVRSVIERPSGQPPVRVDWILAQSSDDYRIVDVYVEGVSMSLTHRQEFASVIQNGGGRISALLDAMRHRLQTSN
jgi:phospholipid transport system substrate-binding protein